MSSPPSPYRLDLLKDKVALVTGGATGINFEIGKYMGLHGAKIALMGRRKEVLDSAVQHLRNLGVDCMGIQGDVRSVELAENTVRAVVDKWGKLDILVNGAAGNFLCAAENLSTNAFKTVGTFNMSRAAFQELKKTKGNIINISATLHYSTTPWQSHAAAAKAGLATEWGDFGIRVNAIAPGPIEETTGMSKLAPGNMMELLKDWIPLHSLGTKKDIALAALFLASDETARYVSGAIIVVDGAAWMFHPRLIERELLQEMDLQRRKSKSKL